MKFMRFLWNLPDFLWDLWILSNFPYLSHVMGFYEFYGSGFMKFMSFLPTRILLVRFICESNESNELPAVTHWKWPIAVDRHALEVWATLSLSLWHIDQFPKSHRVSDSSIWHDALAFARFWRLKSGASTSQSLLSGVLFIKKEDKTKSIKKAGTVLQFSLATSSASSNRHFVAASWTVRIFSESKVEILD